MPGPIVVKLRDLREKRGLTQKQAAELVHETPQTLIDLESGKRPPTYRPCRKSPGATACLSRNFWRKGSPRAGSLLGIAGGATMGIPDGLGAAHVRDCLPKDPTCRFSVAFLCTVSREFVRWRT